jgi:hypothetical protein
MDMKRKGLILCALFVSCFLGINVVLAETKGYIDSGQNPLLGNGVVGAKYTGAIGGKSAIYGWASATSGTTVGGRFLNLSASGSGVYSTASASSGTTFGGKFESFSTSGRGVQGLAAATTGATIGGSFESRGTAGKGVSGSATASSGTTYGGYFRSGSTGGTGVYGWASAGSGVTNGGYFRSSSAAGRGVFGWASATSGFTWGGVFQSNSSSGTGVYGIASATSGTTYGGNFRSQSTLGKGVQGVASATTGVNYGVYGQTSSPYGYGVYSKGNMKVEGRFTVTGVKSAVVKLNDGKSVLMYAVEASENWFEDFGSSRLKDGSALVSIETTFAETVNTDMEYHVFLTPNGDCRGLYVTNKTGNSFEIKELNGGKSDISFSYRIVAKRKGYEDQRLVRVEEEKMAAVDTTQAETMLKDDAMALASHVE